MTWRLPPTAGRARFCTVLASDPMLADASSVSASARMDRLDWFLMVVMATLVVASPIAAYRAGRYCDDYPWLNGSMLFVGRDD